MEPEKQKIMQALDRWIRQRPGLEFGNYRDLIAFRSEMRGITKDGNTAKILLRDVGNRDSITADDLKAAFKRAFSGRLSWTGEGLDYCTGQYWPTEYRRAACAVLASALWARAREDLPAGIDMPGNVLRDKFKRTYGRGVASRWFS